MAPESSSERPVGEIDRPRRRALQLLGVAGLPFALPVSAGRARATRQLGGSRRASDALSDLEDAVDDLEREIEDALDAVERLDDERDVDRDDVEEADERIEEARDHLDDASRFVADLGRGFGRRRSWRGVGRRRFDRIGRRRFDRIGRRRFDRSAGTREDDREAAVDALIDALEQIEDAIDLLEGDGDDDDDDRDDRRDVDDLFEDAEDQLFAAEEASEAVDDAVRDARRTNLDRDEDDAVDEVDRANSYVARFVDDALGELVRGSLEDAAVDLEDALEWVEEAQEALADL